MSEPAASGRHCAPADPAAGPGLFAVPFMPGDGTIVMLAVQYIADYPRGADDMCAFCLGDPCAELSGPETPIGAYFAGSSWAATCPCCDGRPA